eukprot:11382393-Alexandrium_andersonii.AAC.1
MPRAPELAFGAPELQFPGLPPSAPGGAPANRNSGSAMLAFRVELRVRDLVVRQLVRGQLGPALSDC